MSANNDFEKMKSAIELLPEAQDDPTFAERVLAQTAVTPQLGRNVGEDAITSGIWPRFFAASAGFCLGAMLIYALAFTLPHGMPTANGSSIAADESTSIALVYNPLELVFIEENASAVQGDQK